MATTKRKNIQYINRDFSEIRASLVDYARTYFPTTYNDFTPSSVGMMFMEMAAYVGDVLSFYLDNQVQETYLQYARQTNNLYELAYMFGYKPNVTQVSTVDLDFIKKFAQGVVSGLLTPKILLPVFIMLKALGQSAVDAVEDMVSFLKNFKEYAKNIISRIGALFVQELFQLIKKDILNLIQQIIADIQKEKLNKKIAMILKLVSLLIIVANFIKDFRKCKSLVDELLNLLKIATQGWGGDIPLPILFASRLLDGFSDTRAFINVIEEMQKLGIPTGDLPDGTPNLELLSRFAQIKGMSFEETENGKVQVALGALTITPAGLTVPTSAFGKKI